MFLQARRTRTHEKIVGVRNITTNSEQLHKIMELAMDVTTYL
jgi:hypothetical protein